MVATQKRDVVEGLVYSVIEYGDSEGSESSNNRYQMSKYKVSGK